MSSSIESAPNRSGLWVSDKGDEVFLSTTFSMPPTFFVFGADSHRLHAEVPVDHLDDFFCKNFGGPRRWQRVSYLVEFPPVPEKPLHVYASFLSQGDVSWWAVFKDHPVFDPLRREAPFATRGSGYVPLHALTVVGHEDNDPEAVRLIEKARTRHGQ